MLLKLASKTLKLYDFDRYDRSRSVLPVCIVRILITGPGPNAVPIIHSTSVDSNPMA